MAASSHWLDRQTISLNGMWCFAQDPLNVGKREGWERNSTAIPNRTEIRVPSVWEEFFPSYDGVGWYWHDFVVPEQSLRSTALLHFSAINYFAEVWLNGRYLGSHEGGYTPFDLDASSCVRAGTNQLAVRVINPPKDEVGIDGIILKETPCWRALESFNFGGIWQDVSFHLLPPCHVVDCFVRPRIATESAELHLEISNATSSPQAASIEVTVHPAGDRETVATGHHRLVLPAGASEHTLSIAIDNPRLWSPDQPFLYVANVTILTSSGSDSCRVRFGMREFTLENDGFHLNGERLFLKGAFHEGFYPITIAYPRDEAIVRKELSEAKAAGLNLLRFWQIPIHPRVLDLADEIGMLLMDEPPIEWITDSVHTERRCRQEVRDLVRRDRNHPSVVFWTILNEGSVLPDFTRRGPGQPTAQEWFGATVQRIRAELCREARTLDPSRIIIDDSGGWYTGANAYLPDSNQPIPINDVHIYRRAPVDEGIYNELDALGKRDTALVRAPLVGGLPVFVTEFGYGSLPDVRSIVDNYQRTEAREDAEDFIQIRRIEEDLERVFRAERLDEVFPSVSALCAATQRLQAEGNCLQMEALRANPRVFGYVIHAFSAGGVILCAEMVDVWRNPKPICRLATEIHRDIYPVIRVWPRVIYAGRPLPIQVTVVSDRGRLGPARLDVFLISEKSEELIAREDVGISGVHTNVGPWTPMVASPTRDAKIRVTLRQSTSVIAVSEHPIMVMPELPWRMLSKAVRVISSPGDQRYSFYLAARGVAVTEDAASAIVTISPGRSSDEQLRARLNEALSLAEAGGVSIFLTPIEAGDLSGARTLFPWLGGVRSAVGNWIPVGHYVREHAIFSGLPSPGLMEWPYANVCPTHTLVDTPSDETPAGAVSLHATIFEKPERAWAGKDLIIRRHGRGWLVLSQLKILDHLGTDPFADRLLYNLLAWAQANVR